MLEEYLLSPVCLLSASDPAVAFPRPVNRSEARDKLPLARVN